MSASFRLALDVTPMLDDQWTGIPVFTGRLATALLAALGERLCFCCGLQAVPREHVLLTLRLQSGMFLRRNLERKVYRDLGLVDPGVPLLFPSVKQTFGVCDREASVVHDMSTLFMPESHEESNVAHHLDVLRDELLTDEMVFCVSEATRAALTLAFPSVAGRTSVLYQYADWPEAFERMDFNAPRLGLSAYAAVIGTIEPRKNLQLLLDVLDAPSVRRSNLQFVVIGRRGWKMDAVMESLDETVKQRIVFTGFVSEFNKYRLLRHCEFLVYPSLYEGFGIPALEAMSLGKPVLASFTSSLPEIIGEGGVYFDPLSREDFAEKLQHMQVYTRGAGVADRARAIAAAFTPERMVAPVLGWINGGVA